MSGMSEDAKPSYPGPFRRAVFERMAETGEGYWTAKEEVEKSRAREHAVVVGYRVEAKVKRIVDYGVFLTRPARAGRPRGRGGLLHIADMRPSPRVHPRELFREGDWITVTVVRYDEARDRLYFGWSAS